MSSLTAPTQIFLRAVFAALALTPLCGCNQNELRARVEQVEARVNSAAPETAAPKPVPAPPAPTAPLRRSPETLEDWNRRISGELLAAAAGVGMVFQAEVLDNDDVRISSARAPFSKDTSDFLKSIGFQNSGDEWTRRFKRKEIDDVDVKIRKRLLRVAQELQNAVAETSRLYPGKAAVTPEHKPAKSALVYTGNPQDVAVAPGATDVFIEAGSKMYVRSGRLSAGTDRRIKLDDVELAGISALPADAVSMSVAADGTINAAAVNGVQSSLGKLTLAKIDSVDVSGAAFVPHAGAAVNAQAADSTALIPGHLELPDVGGKLEALHHQLRAKNALVSLLESFTSVEEPVPATAAAEAPRVPLVLHASMPRTVEHLKALHIANNVSGNSVTIGVGSAVELLVPALVKVMDGLKKRLAVHEENLLNAGKTRDAEGRLNAYRRKTVEIGSKGEVVEGVDKTELPRTYKPGDPDAGPDGFVVLSNVNKAIETTEYKAEIEEYKMLREALQRLDARQIFPEAPKGP